jgi:hypothetical protein
VLQKGMQYIFNDIHIKVNSAPFAQTQYTKYPRPFVAFLVTSVTASMGLATRDYFIIEYLYMALLIAVSQFTLLNYLLP